MTNERKVKILQHADGALMECQVISDFAGDVYNGENVNLDDVLALSKRALDHLNRLRREIKKELNR